MKNLLATMALTAMFAAMMGCEPANAQGSFMEGFNRGWGSYTKRQPIWQQAQYHQHTWVQTSTNQNTDGTQTCTWRCYADNATAVTAGYGYCPRP